MTIRLDPAKEIQAEFPAGSARGVGVDEYAAGLIESAARLPHAAVFPDHKLVASRETIG
jgi:hypothetical protein